MAYLASAAATYCQAIGVGIPISAIEVVVADQINSIMWDAYPWRWAMKSMTAIPLVDGTQDYAFAPADYMRLIAARIAQTNTDPDEYDELSVVKFISPDLMKNAFRQGLQQIAYLPQSQKLRLSRAAAVPTGNTYEIQGEYQFMPTKITAMSATLPFPDQYFSVFCDGFLWKVYQLSKDDRAGTLQVTKNGSAAYTGQMGIFYNGILGMLDAEDYGAGDNIFPDSPLGFASRASGFSPIFSI